MPDFNEKLSELNLRLEKMVEYQQYFYREINLIRQEIYDLKLAAQRPNVKTDAAAGENPAIEESNYQSPYSPPVSDLNSSANTYQLQQQSALPQQEAPNFNQKFAEKSFSAAEKSNLEKIIGENLVSLIGIAILILGVGIGAKYAIDRDLISPWARIVLGYLVGFGLLGFAVRLKNKYRNFSAVLLSGSLAIMYFITFAAYSYYDLFGQIPAYAVMFFLTDAAVIAALRYNRQVIAHIGLVGAYAIPFLLGGDSGNIGFLFGYIAVINAGILSLSVHKYWKPLFYSSFFFTWATFAVWFLSGYKQNEHFTFALFIAIIFFLIFYATFLAYKLINKERFSPENVALLLSNSFVFYGFGYAILKAGENGSQFLGLFTVANAALHFAAAFLIKKLAFVDRSVTHLLAGLGLIFVTIAIPVQLNGNWVTVFWAAEAVLLFWLGRKQGIQFYEILSYPPMILTLLSLLSEWVLLYDRRQRLDFSAAITPFFNVYFLTAIFVAAAFALIYLVNAKEKFKSADDKALLKPASVFFSIFFPAIIYNAIRNEIGNYWYLQIVKTALPFEPGVVSASGRDFQIDNDLNLFNVVTQIDYTLLFVAALAFVNAWKLKKYQFAPVNFALAAIALFVFLTIGLYEIGELRESYLLQTSADSFARGVFHIFIRYVSYFFVAGLFAAVYDLMRRQFVTEKLLPNKSGFVLDLAFYGSLWWLASSELINLLELFGVGQADRLGLSILWGFYALVLIVLGIWRNKKHLRLGAFVLSGLTLVKLFFYDIAFLDTISKTVVFVSLGVFLLLISFLYNKYKHLIFDQKEA